MGLGREINYSRRVRWSDCDVAGIWRFTAALTYTEEAEAELLREAGVLPELYRYLVRVYVDAQFRRPAVFDDFVTVRLRLLRLGRSSLHYEYGILCEDETAAFGRFSAVYVQDSGKAQPLPEQARQRLEAWFGGRSINVE
jgi:acyl-CoA thioester hydrolase